MPCGFYAVWRFFESLCLFNYALSNTLLYCFPWKVDKKFCVARHYLCWFPTQELTFNLLMNCWTDTNNTPTLTFAHTEIYIYICMYINTFIYTRKYIHAYIYVYMYCFPPEIKASYWINLITKFVYFVKISALLFSVLRGEYWKQTVTIIDQSLLKWNSTEVYMRIKTSSVCCSITVRFYW